MPTNATPERPNDVDARGVDWFRRFPTGGTSYQRDPVVPPSTVNDVSSRFREMPNGGGTVFQAPAVEPRSADRVFQLPAFEMPRRYPTGGATVFVAPSDGGGENGENGDEQTTGR